MRWSSWPVWKRRVAVYGGLLAAYLALGGWMAWCPDHGSAGGRTVDTELSTRLRGHVEKLAGEIGERNVFKPGSLDRAATCIVAFWRELGLKPVELEYRAAGFACKNLECELPGSGPKGAIVVGAHYDSVSGCPGADDNASGVAAMLELGRLLARRPPGRPIRFVAFANEEPPFFQTESMGSRVYAKLARTRGDSIHAMLSLEAIGFYADRKGSQDYPPLLKPFYPSTGNFIAVVGELSQRKRVHRLVELLAPQLGLPVECAATFGFFPGVTWSDHASFTAEGFPGVMVTDTAPYRNPNYHTAGDLPSTLDYDRLALLTAGLARAILALAGEP